MMFSSCRNEDSKTTNNRMIAHQQNQRAVQKIRRRELLHKTRARCEILHQESRMHSEFPFSQFNLREVSKLFI